MYNYFMLVAELISFTEEKVVLSYTHPFLNSEGVKETTEITVLLSSSLHYKILQQIPLHSSICVKGMIGTNLLGDTILVAEKILFMKGEKSI